MGGVDVKNEEKAPSDTNKRGKGFGSWNIVQREDFAGTSEALNMQQVKFDCGEGKEGGRFLECLRLTTAYLSTKLEVGSNVKMSIRNGKIFETAWPDPVGPNPVATKVMLQAESGTKAKRVEISASTWARHTAWCSGSARTTCSHVSRDRRNGKRRRTSRACSGYLKALSPCCTNTTRTRSITT